MQPTAELLLAIGSILLVGLAMDFLGRRTILPRVTLLLMFGMLVGKEAFNLIPSIVTTRFELITDIALLMVGFLLGGKLTLATMKQSGSQMVWISICAVSGTFALVFLGLLAFGVPLQLAILLGCIASATAPAASIDIVMESGFEGHFADLLLSIVAIDDAWALIVFSFGLALVASMTDQGNASLQLVSAGYHISGALILGLLIGFPAAYLTGRIRPGQPKLTEALGLVFLCGGVALWLDISYLIAAMVMGAVITNFAKHHDYPFHEIENIERPFMVIFFVLAGASLEISAVWQLGVVGIIYVLCRISGKLLGARLGGEISRADPKVKRWMGIALLPQAGVAIGMALVVSHQLPEYRQMILSVVISTTIFFELIGPIFTRLALRRAQD